MKATCFILLLSAAACHRTAAAPATAPPARVAVPAGLPVRMLAGDFDALVAHRVLTPLALEPVGREELSFPVAPGRVAGRRVTITNAMPAGWSETLYVDGAQRVWVAHRPQPLGHVPDGVIISATRVFSQTVELPAGTTFGGVVDLVDDPQLLRPEDTARAPAA